MRPPNRRGPSTHPSRPEKPPIFEARTGVPNSHTFFGNRARPSDGGRIAPAAASKTQRFLTWPTCPASMCRSENLGLKQATTQRLFGQISRARNGEAAAWNGRAVRFDSGCVVSFSFAFAARPPLGAAAGRSVRSPTSGDRRTRGRSRALRRRP